MDLLSQIGESLPLLLGAILVAVALLVLLLLVLLSRAQHRAQYADLSAGGDGGTAANGGDGGGAEVVDLRSSPDAADLRHSFDRALALLRRYLPGRGTRYQLPWFMSFGQEAAGKSTALACTQLKLPFGEPDTEARKSPCLWWLFDRAVVLDVAGSLALRLDGSTSDQPSWRELLTLLAERRSRRPLDGMLLTIPVTELAGVAATDSQARNEIAHHAQLLRSKLDQARQELRFDFPVYVLITQCDRLPGFADLVDTVEPVQLQQMFGWSNPSAPDVPYSDAWVDDAFDSVLAGLDQQQLRTLQDGRALAEPQAYLALPAAVDSLRETLRIYWSQLFAGGDGALPVRGLYLSGGEGFGDSAPPHDADYRVWGPPADDKAHRRVDFLTDLFSYKVFYEWTLSRPLQEALDRRRRRRRVLRWALVAALVLGPPLLWWSGRRLAADSGTVAAQFLGPSQRALDTALHDPADEATLALRVHSVLAAVSQVPDYRLRSFALPASWWSSYSREVTEAGSRIYHLAVYPALSQDLERKLQGTRGEVPILPTPYYDVKTVPEFVGLQDMTDQLDGLAQDTSRYDRFAASDCATGAGDWLAQFQKLVAAFDPSLKAEPPTFSAEGYYQDVLCRAGNLPRFAPLPATADRLDSRALELGGGMSGSLFGKANALIRDLDSLQGQLDSLSRQAPPPDQADQVYRTLVTTIDRTSRDLADPRLAWAGRTTLDLGDAYKALLASIAKSPFLGLQIAQAIRQTCDAGFRVFRRDLAGYSTAATGPLLVQKDGQPQLQLSSTVLGLRTALESLLNQYATPPTGPTLALNPPAGTYLSWNAQTLTGASGLLSSYATFMNTSFQGFPGFQQVVDQSARGSVEANVLSQVAAAQQFPSMPAQSTRELREAHLQAQVVNLSGASVPLNQLLQGFVKPPPVNGCPGAPTSAYCLLDRTLLNQRATLLQQLDRLLSDQALYDPVDGSIPGWDGAENLAWTAFAVPNAAGLSGYLTNQRRIVQALNDQYATPVLTAVPLGTAWGPDPSDPYQRWTVIGSDLTDYTNKAAGNAIQSLETYVGTDMSGATTANCLSLPPASGACFAPTTPAALTVDPPPCDFFLGVQAGLQRQVGSRCQQLTGQSGTAAYGEIAQAFAAGLQGKYPFAPEGTTAGATPADLRTFFTVYDAQRPTVLSALGLASPPWPAATAQRIRAFLASMDAVRSFFAPFLDPPAAPSKTGPATPALTAPTYALQVDLRPAPAREAGGNDIIVRTLQAGPGAVSTGGAAPSPFLWAYGQPVSVALRWALNSPAAPQLPPNDPTARLSDRTVTFTYGDPWALLRLLRGRAAATGDPADTLLFEVPTSAAADATGGTATLQTTARVFLRIDLANPLDGSVMTVPAFPTAAPLP